MKRWPRTGSTRFWGSHRTSGVGARSTSTTTARLDQAAAADRSLEAAAGRREAGGQEGDQDRGQTRGESDRGHRQACEGPGQEGREVDESRKDEVTRLHRPLSDWRSSPAHRADPSHRRIQCSSRSFACSRGARHRRGIHDRPGFRRAAEVVGVVRHGRCLAGYLIGGFLGAPRTGRRRCRTQGRSGPDSATHRGHPRRSARRHEIGLAIAIPVSLYARRGRVAGRRVGDVAVPLSRYRADSAAPRNCSWSRVCRPVRSCVRGVYDDADGFLVDSSAVMDMQLLPLCQSGLFRDDLLVPRFILDELQGMADAGDERGRRARRGRKPSRSSNGRRRTGCI